MVDETIVETSVGTLNGSGHTINCCLQQLKQSGKSHHGTTHPIVCQLWQPKQTFKKINMQVWPKRFDQALAYAHAKILFTTCLNSWEFYVSKICLITQTMLFTIVESNLCKHRAKANSLLERDSNRSKCGRAYDKLWLNCQTFQAPLKQTQSRFLRCFSTPDDSYLPYGPSRTSPPTKPAFVL